MAASETGVKSLEQIKNELIETRVPEWEALHGPAWQRGVGYRKEFIEFLESLEEQAREIHKAQFDGVSDEEEEETKEQKPERIRDTDEFKKFLEEKSKQGEGVEERLETELADKEHVSYEKVEQAREKVVSNLKEQFSKQSPEVSRQFSAPEPETSPAPPRPEPATPETPQPQPPTPQPEKREREEKPEAPEFVKKRARKYGRRVIRRVGRRAGSYLKRGAKRVFRVIGRVARRGLGKAVSSGVSAVSGAVGSVIPEVAAGIGIAFAIIGYVIGYILWAILYIGILLIGYTIVVAIILFIINSGAYIVPPGGFGEGPQTPSDSAYISIDKLASSTDPARSPSPRQEYQNSDLAFTVTYEVAITARQGTLTNVSITYDCRVNQDSPSGQDCPSDPTIPQPDGGTISPTSPFTFTYDQTYSGSGFQDSLVIDTITVTADAPDSLNEKASTTASICIGDCPDECPSVWPTDEGYITQGAYPAPLSCTCKNKDTGEVYACNCSHTNMEAIDIGGVSLRSVAAGHSGTAEVVYDNDCLGNYIEITSSCEGKTFISQYAHLEGISISNGQQVDTGQRIGISGNTGSCTTGPHLHYRFTYPDDNDPKYPDESPYMMRNYIPKDVPRGCITVAGCNVSIP
ncbi:MAG: M23 family metallopeptidase [Candidatus Woesebacteria bacterium]|jgi:murein DD-endopeptidase MepM/ murein hydrolase activator NlpD